MKNLELKVRFIIIICFGFEENVGKQMFFFFKNIIAKCDLDFVSI